MQVRLADEEVSLGNLSLSVFLRGVGAESKVAGCGPHHSACVSGENDTVVDQIAESDRLCKHVYVFGLVWFFLIRF